METYKTNRMKKINFLPLVLFIAVSTFFTSCKKDVEDRLPGNWAATWTETEVEEFTDSTGTSTSTSTETIKSNFTFDENGTGTLTIENEVINFTWTATEETFTMTMTVDGDSETLVFDVLTNKKDEQKWTTTMTDTYSYDGVTYNEVTTYDLSLTKD